MLILRLIAAFLLWNVLTALSLPDEGSSAGYGLLVIGYAVFAYWVCFRAVPLRPRRSARTPAD